MDNANQRDATALVGAMVLVVVFVVGCVCGGTFMFLLLMRNAAR